MQQVRNIAWLIVILLVPCLVWGGGYPDSEIEALKNQANTPLTIEISKLKEGQILREHWGKIPIFVYHRTNNDIVRLESANLSLLADPESKNSDESIARSHYISTSGVISQLYLAGARDLNKLNYRSHRERYMVVVGLGPHSGCYLTFKSQKNNEDVVFHDPCTSTSFDAAGRIFKGTVKKFTGNSKAKFNLRLVPYYYESQSILYVGPKNGYKSLPEYIFNHEALLAGLDPTHKLMVAARYNDHNQIHAALKEGANPTYWKLGEGSPLDAALLGSSTDIVRYLLRLGASATPNLFELAESLGRKDVVKLLAKKEGAI